MKTILTKAIYTACVLLLMFGSMVVRSGAQNNANAPTATAGKKIEQVGKNIKVLNGMPADQVIPTMEFYEASLNVGCEFCHAPGGLDKDDRKQKEISRKMILMVRALNKDNFGGRPEVTCYTCHRGTIDPSGIPPVVGADYKFPDPDMPNEAPEMKPLAGPPPEELLDNYLKGLGGMATLSKISTRVVKATVTESAGRGDGLTLELVSKGDTDMSFLHTSIGDTIRVRTGEVGWEHNVFGVIRDVRGGEIDELKIKWDTLYFATHLKEMLSKLESRQTKLNGLDVYEVSGVAWGHMPVTLTFGKGTGNLLRLVYLDENDNGHSKVQVDFSDYRSAYGTRFPYSWTIAWALGYQKLRVDQLQQNVPVDDGRFVRPPNPSRTGGNGGQ
jgi:photosynthetic reaction center cytochrome c subunit